MQKMLILEKLVVLHTGIEAHNVKNYGIAAVFRRNYSC